VLCSPSDSIWPSASDLALPNSHYDFSHLLVICFLLLPSIYSQLPFRDRNACIELRRTITHLNPMMQLLTTPQAPATLFESIAMAAARVNNGRSHGPRFKAPAKQSYAAQQRVALELPKLAACRKCFPVRSHTSYPRPQRETDPLTIPREACLL
jgi:hypothetical protein